MYRSRGTILPRIIRPRYVFRRGGPATPSVRAELREGLEQMHLSRTHRIIAALVASALLLVLSARADAQNADTLITRTSLGPAELGLTADELQAALGSEYNVSDEMRITVDFDGHVISRDGEVQFRAAMAGTGPELNLFIVSNTDYATAEGVGPMTLIADAEAAYGDATLSWSPDNESREFVAFENGAWRSSHVPHPGYWWQQRRCVRRRCLRDQRIRKTAPRSRRYGFRAGSATTVLPIIAAQPTATPEPTADDRTRTDGDPRAQQQHPNLSRPLRPSLSQQRHLSPSPLRRRSPNPSRHPMMAMARREMVATAAMELPRTGLEEIVMVSIVATLFVLGGAAVTVERRLGLCPAWLSGRRS